ncbi:hypothetical protein [Polyangium jinanense]|uniref:Lipoprotein n=1 Tax=Polyangium jinanense TaxID=2829994 RepID=A0A9X4ARM7_9BACT|nr:hypothetical protein [Polyangium jinanense]MDC3955320.1 hypothetical protein [Polyangium jinanense]MDC3981621.1 hypothetical protein [Polyangium jinanense]
MTPHRFFILASAIGLGLLTAGCLAEDGVGPIDGVGLETLEGGDHGTNSLGTDDFHGHADMLWAAADLSLNDPENAALAALLADTGSRTLAYAIHCALPQGTVGPGGHVGWGHLETTTEWTTRGLTLSEKLDLFTCMIVNINPKEEPVQIRITGDSVTSNGISGFWQTSKYNIEEALWVARLSDTGEREYFVWPLDEIVLPCPNTYMSLLTRTCTSGDNPGDAIPDCNVEMRTSTDTDCTQNPVTKNWSCLGRPAIKTWLSSWTITAAPGCGDVP